MANNLLLGTINRLTNATLKSGTGGGAPLLQQDASYPESNVKNSDRSSPWVSSAAPTTPVQVDFDLLSAQTIGAGAALGFTSALGGTTGISSIQVFSATAYPGGPWSSRMVLVPSPEGRDWGYILSPTVSARYWRFEIALSIVTAFSIGRLWLGNPTDIGIYHDPDGLYELSRNRLETQLPSGAYILNDLGRPGGRYSFGFSLTDATLMGQLKALREQAGSFVIFDPEGQVREVFIPGGRIGRIRRAGAAIWDVAPFDMVVMP